MHESWDPAKYGFLEHPEKRYKWWPYQQVDDPHCVFLVAQSDEIVTFLIATIEQEIPIYRLKEFGFIHDVWVEEEYRHEGIARQLTMLAMGRYPLWASSKFA